jgi:hypothetical protein
MAGATAKISELDVATQAHTTDQLEANQAGSSRSITVQQLADAIRVNYGAGILAFLQNPTSANLAAAMTDETGTAGALVFSGAPTMTNPNVGNQTTGDNSTKAASTNFVQAAIAAIPPVTGFLPINNPSATGQLTVTGATQTPVFAAHGTLNSSAAIDVLSINVDDQTAGGSGALFRVKGGVGANTNLIVIDRAGDLQVGGYTNTLGALPLQTNGADYFAYTLGNGAGGNIGVYAGLSNPTFSTFGRYGSIYLNGASPGLPYYNNNGTTGWDRLVGETATQTLTNKSATTPSPGDNTTKVATTAFVAAAIASGASISVGTTPPGSPNANQLWWSSEAGQMFIYYNDGNSSQWVPASPATTTAVPGADPGCKTTFLTGANVAVSSIPATPTAIVNTGSIGGSGQTWKISATACLGSVSASVLYSAAISNGTSVVASGEALGPATNQACVVTLEAIVSLTAATTFTLLVAGNAGNGNALRAPLVNTTFAPSMNDKMTSITAVRIA